jgi:hypothetical protein
MILGIAAEVPWNSHRRSLELSQKRSGLRGMDHVVLLLS